MKGLKRILPKAVFMLIFQKKRFYLAFTRNSQQQKTSHKDFCLGSFVSGRKQEHPEYGKKCLGDTVEWKDLKTGPHLEDNNLIEKSELRWSEKCVNNLVPEMHHSSSKMHKLHTYT